MYFDLTPRSRAPRHRPQSPRSASATSTTTLLPFRRSGHAVDVALSPVQEYTQPQWSLRQSPEPLWSPHRVPPPTASSSAAAPSPVRESFVQQQQRTGAWAGAAPPHAYCVGGYVNPSDGLRPPARSPCRESEAPAFYTTPSSHSGGETAAAALPRQPFAASPTESTAAAAAAIATSAPQRRDAVLSGDRRRQLNGSAAAAPSPVSRPRGRGIAEVRPGCTTSTERVRYRNNVTKKLIDLYDEVAELYECRDNMNFQVTQAMRSDPRYTKERHGEVRLAYKPTPAQQAAMTGVDTALEALHDACHELVACYLTPEEKRYLGIDTHLFQTHAERSSTYQYAPPSAKDKVKKALQPPAPPGGAGAASSRASSTASSTRRHHRTRESGEAAQQQQQQTPTRDVRFTSQATSLPSAATPPPPMQSPPVLSPSPSPIAEERTASTVRVPSPSPPLAAAAVAPLAFSPPVRQAFAASPAPEDTAAEGSASSPERMYARAASTSSLGGGGWPSDTASATVRAASAVAAPQSPMMAKAAVAAPGGATMRGPQGQLLVKVPVQPPRSPTLKLPPGIPPGAKLVKMPMSVSLTSPAPSGSFPPPPAAAAAAALPSSHPPSHPPSRTNSAINRTTASAPKAPATRAEFMKFLIDSDSDSTA